MLLGIILKIFFPPPSFLQQNNSTKDVRLDGKNYPYAVHIIINIKVEKLRIIATFYGTFSEATTFPPFFFFLALLHQSSSSAP